MDTFCASNRNTAYYLERLIHQNNILYLWNGYIANVLVSVFDRMHGENLKSFKFLDGWVVGIPWLNERVEEADIRLVFHMLHAAKEEHKSVAIHLQELDSFVIVWTWRDMCICLYWWFSQFHPVHELVVQLEESLCKVLPAIHTLTGCDYTSKFGTKATSLKASPETFLKVFGTMEVDIENKINLAEK